MSRLQGETREPGNNIHLDSPGFTGTLREKSKLGMTELSPWLPQDQGQTKVIAVGGFLAWGKTGLVCFIDSFFLSTNSYWVPTKCQTLCYPIFHWEKFIQVQAVRGYHLNCDKERHVYLQANEVAVQAEFQGLHLIIFSLFCILWVPQRPHFCWWVLWKGQIPMMASLMLHYTHLFADLSFPRTLSPFTLGTFLIYLCVSIFNADVK